MMAANTIESISKKVKDIDYYTDALGKDNIDRLRASVSSCEKIFGVEVNALNRKKGLKGSIKCFFNRKPKLYKVLHILYSPFYSLKSLFYIFVSMNKIKKRLKTEKAKLLIVLGGDDISPYYGKILLLQKLIEIRLYSKKMPVFLLGQTIGPFGSILKMVVKKALSDCYIFTREKLNYTYLYNELGMKNVMSSADLAFLDLPYQDNKDMECEVLEKYKLVKDKYITVVPSGLIRCYTSNNEAYLRNYLEIVRDILEKFEDEEKVVFMEHVKSRKGQSVDGIIINQLYSRLSEIEKERVILVTDKLLPVQLRFILGNGLFTITGRMHPAVSTFQMGKPAISIAYSIKYNGVVGEAFGMQHLIVNGAGNKLWENEQVCNEVKNTVSIMLSDYPNLVENIKNKLIEVKTDANVQIDKICSVLDNMN
jgi:colanic acid/amylovoran biosynthesis protein